MKARRNKHSLRSQQIRIIGGAWRRTPLSVVDIEGLRPTPDRVRETVFNWINHLWHGEWAGRNCLDMFAGTGAFGFEAASRGAQQVMMLESSMAAWRQLETIKAKLNADQVQVVRGDALHVVQGMISSGQYFDLIVVDPPYQQDLLSKALTACTALLSKKGLVYAESSEPLDVTLGEDNDDLLSKWTIVRSGRAGMVHYYLLEQVK